MAPVSMMLCLFMTKYTTYINLALDKMSMICLTLAHDFHEQLDINDIYSHANYISHVS